MGDDGSKHDKVLNRIHLWIAVLGGVVTLTIGVYNVKTIFFSGKKAPVAAEAAMETTSKTPVDPNSDGKLTRGEWKGTRESFDLRDLDENGVLTGQEQKNIRFESLDRDGDGYVTLLEWHITRRSFSKFDTDGDRRIGPEEFSAR